jgi:hypothetical protein
MKIEPQQKLTWDPDFWAWTHDSFLCDLSANFLFYKLYCQQGSEIDGDRMNLGGCFHFWTEIKVSMCGVFILFAWLQSATDVHQKFETSKTRNPEISNVEIVWKARLRTPFARFVCCLLLTTCKQRLRTRVCLIGRASLFCFVYFETSFIYFKRVFSWTDVTYSTCRELFLTVSR